MLPVINMKLSMKISEQQEDSFKGTIESPDCFGNLRRRGVSIHFLSNLETDLLFGPNEGLCWALGQSKTVDHVEISIHLYWQLSCCILCEVSRSTVFRKSFMRWIVKQIKYYRECPGMDKIKLLHMINIGHINPLNWSSRGGLSPII